VRDFSVHHILCLYSFYLSFDAHFQLCMKNKINAIPRINAMSCSK
jgi:hypothetical protein